MKFCLNIYDNSFQIKENKASNLKNSLNYLTNHYHHLLNKLYFGKKISGFDKNDQNYGIFTVKLVLFVQGETVLHKIYCYLRETGAI